MLYFLAFSGLANGISAIIFGLFVYFKNKYSDINRSYALLSLGIAIWGFAYYFFPLATKKEQALISFQILHIGAILIAPSYLWFILSLLDLHKKFKQTIIFSYIIGIFFLIVTPTKLFIKDMVPIYIFPFWAIPGIVYHFYLVFWFGCVFFAWFCLIKQYKKFSETKRNQLKYVLIASLFGFLGGATNYFLYYRIYVPPVGTFLVTVHVIILAYAVFKYRLMDIRVAITRTGIFVAVYTLVLGLPFLLATLGKDWLIWLFGVNWWIVPLVSLAVLATVGPFVYIYLQKRAEAIILREQHTYRKTLEQAARELASIHSLKRLLNLITHIVTKTVRISHSAIYLYDEKSNQFLLKSVRNLKRESITSLDEKDPLAEWLRNQKEPLVYEELNQKAQETSNSIFKELEKKMQSLNATVIVPGFLRDRLLGLLILGNKRSGGFYTLEDLNTFSVLANEAALAIENAQLYENMEEQVRQRTKELVEVQKQLIHAEKLATVGTLAGGVAHEINNPLTAILTNVQMLLTDSKTFQTDSKESLELIEEATKRCRTIVQKLMTYAKKPLEPTKMSEVDLLKAIKNVISFLGYQLEQENIKIVIKAKEGAYWVTGNQNELEQVITNIVLNAKDAIKKIKKSGSIDINLLKSDDWIKIEIEDEGCGIPKEIMPKIFDPFFTTKEVGKGTGLGLSICQAIVEKHNGQITIQSEPNKGSIFTIQLPKAELERTVNTSDIKHSVS